MYRWRAKGRHGTHSPFIYYIAEDIVQRRHGDIHKPENDMGNVYDRILARIAHWQQCEIARGVPAVAGRWLMLFPGAEEEWEVLFEKATASLQMGGIVVMPGIHRTATHTALWDRLRTQAVVTDSIDLYGCGLLFSREEQKQQRHFVLLAH